MLDFLNTLFRSLSSLWEMSLTAAYAAAILIVLRLVLKKRAPRQVLCLLWLVVFARLLIPVSLESPLSIVPEARPVQEQLHLPRQEAGGQPHVNPVTPTAPVQNPAQGQNPGTAANPVISNPNPPALMLPGDTVPAVPAPEAPAPFPWQAVLSGVWLAGAVTMSGCGLISYLRLRRRLFDAIRAPDGAWEHPAVDSPFILGMLRPRIYLPAGLTGRPRQFILCHERAHLRHLDHIVKPVCWAALALHWFNPLVWAAYLLMSRDIEAACDEAVLRRLGPQVKADYSYTLLALAAGRRLPAPSPLAFDEGDAKGRIKNVLGYRRPALWVIVVSAVMAVMAAVCLLTDPVAAEPPGDTPDPSPTASASQPPEASLADSLLDPWMKEVLDGERTFFNATGSAPQEFNIHQLGAFFYGEPVNITVNADRLAVIDLDKDGLNEMVIWPGTVDDDYLYSVVGYAILHRHGDEINGYSPGYRSFGDLKSDGSFTVSSSASDWGIMTASFPEGRLSLSHNAMIHWCESGGGEIRYFVNARKATEEDFLAAANRQSLKAAPAWFTYADGQLQPYLPASAELASQSEEGGVKLWLEGDEYSDQYPWLEWHGLIFRLGTVLPDPQSTSPTPICADFDGDGQDEVVLQWLEHGFLHYDVYDWSNGQLIFADTFYSEDLLLRFNQNNVAAYNKDTREFSVTYAHTEGDPDSEDYNRRYVTGSTALPINFFDGFEHIRDGYTYAYANDFRQISLNPEDNSFLLELLFCPADETMKDLTYVDTPPYTDYANHYMAGKPVGAADFTLRYNGVMWVLEEPDHLDMGPGVISTPMGMIDPPALDTPVVDLMNGLPDNPNTWYKVAELPDDMIRLYSHYYGAQTLIRWGENRFKVFDHTAHTGRAIPPALKKLGGDPNTYGLLGVISNVGSGTGASLSELVVYDLDASPSAMDHVHDWKPLVDEFNGGRAFRYDGNTHSVICTYEGQTAELIIDGGEEMYRRIGEEGIRLTVTGEIVSYWFNDDGAMEIEFPIQAFIGSDVVNAPLIWPWFLRWTIRFDRERVEFETIPGSCELFTYVGQ